MTEEQKKAILAASDNWSQEFLLAKLRELIMPTPIVELLHTKISKYLLDEMDEISSELENDFLIHNNLDNNVKISYAKKLIKENRAILMSHSEHLYSDILDDLKIIQEDNKWRKTKEGRLIIEIEEWICSVKLSLPSEMSDTIVLGRNILDDNPCNIIIGGYSEKMTSLQIESYFTTLSPPVMPFFVLPKACLG